MVGKPSHSSIRQCLSLLCVWRCRCCCCSIHYARRRYQHTAALQFTESEPTQEKKKKKKCVHTVSVCMGTSVLGHSPWRAYWTFSWFHWAQYFAHKIVFGRCFKYKIAPFFSKLMFLICKKNTSNHSNDKSIIHMKIDAKRSKNVLLW